MPDPLRALDFDPSAATVVRTPPGSGYGNWVGGKVSYEPESGLFVLFYRERRPLEQGRAGVCGIAVSEDGVAFRDVWTATKGDFAANSIEEGHCVRVGDEWRCYVSYEMSGTSTWRIDVLRSDRIETLNAQSRRTVLWPHDFGIPWIKDPFVMPIGDQLWVYAVVPPRTGPTIEGDRVHAGPLDATVLAVSDDGLYFPTIEYVFEPPGDDSWHGRRARINSVIEWGGGYIATFDGGRTFYDNYEEHTGLATSVDGRVFERLTEPWVTSPHGCVRYACAVRALGRIFVYFEYTREDGSHDLRVAEISEG
ncbi:MAG: hypothetical protein ABFS21_09460 [Actinomycetota bacterium]